VRCLLRVPFTVGRHSWPCKGPLSTVGRPCFLYKKKDRILIAFHSHRSEGALLKEKFYLLYRTLNSRVEDRGRHPTVELRLGGVVSCSKMDPGNSFASIFASVLIRKFLKQFSSPVVLVLKKSEQGFYDPSNTRGNSSRIIS